MTAYLLCPDLTIRGAEEPEARPEAVLVEDGVIAAIGPADAIGAGAQRIELNGQILLPGLVNAHQHGRGITSLQLGYEDGILEHWMIDRRRRRSMDPYAATLLAAAEMIAAGVTATIQANTPYGTGDYANELRGSIRAYTEAGLRAMVGVGAMDRAFFVYPHEADEHFRATLPEDLARAAYPSGTVYAGDGPATIALMESLRAETAGSTLISLAYAPAGPQWVSDGLFAALAADAKRNGTPIHMHALESWAQVRALQRLYPEGLMRRMEALGVLGPLTSLAHAVWLSDDDLAVAARHGVTVVRNPGSNLRLRAGIAPLAAYLELGVSVAIGTDNTAINDDEDLLAELRLAGRLAGGAGWREATGPDARALLRMATTAGASAMGLAGQIGIIGPGARADIIAIDRSALGSYVSPAIAPLSLLMGRAGARHVRMTMCDGRILYRNGHYPDLDIEAVRAAAAASASGAEEVRNAENVEKLLGIANRHYVDNEHAGTAVTWTPLARNWIAPISED